MQKGSKIEQRKRRDFLTSVGLNAVDVVAWVQKWHTLQYHCEQNGKVNELSFYDYITLALQADVRDPKMIGRDIDSYQLGRYGDAGGYTLDNCRFITKKQNLDERMTSGAMERVRIANKDFHLSRRKNVVVVTPEGVTHEFHGLVAAGEFIGCYSAEISTAVRRKGKVKGHIVTYRE